ncbi:MAG: VWA domain-containing protein [Planctomyces sp.]|nr:VWA domain-containing protein [Planctomyces sp.]
MTSRSTSLPALGVSLLVNLTMLIPLNFVMMSAAQDDSLTEITSLMDDLGPEEFQFNAVSKFDQVGMGSGENLSLTSASLSAAADVGPAETAIEQKIQEAILPEAPRIADTVPLPSNAQLTARVAVRGTSDKVDGGIAGSMDRITHEIRQSLEERQTLVMWLFDASGSLNDRRREITERFENVYRQLGDLGDTDGLHTAVVSYGEQVKLISKDPVKDVREFIEPVRSIEVDESGIENVFTAVRMSVDKWKQWKRSEGRWNKLLFIVTDERGDDAEAQLEEVISLCKRYGVRVYVVGNAAVFGQKIGYVRWKYADGFEEDIEVDQGPETAFPEGLQLPSWGGGDWRSERISANYGPYALTRLCAETGGRYLIAEDTHGRQFDPAVMRDYTPDYRPVKVQESEIAKHPSKMALVRAAEMTLKGERFMLPQTEFRAFNDNVLRTQLTEAQRPVATVFYRIDELYKVLKEGEKSRPNLKESRWRAAFDLALGRLLAMHTRYDGYNRMLADMKVSPATFSDAKNNHWRIAPSKDIDIAKVGPLVKQRADQARMYLSRVIDEHPGTPWAMLAQRELQHELGWQWQEYHMAVAGMDLGNNASDEEVARLLLAEDEMRQQQMQAAPQAPERQRPRL